MFRIFYDRVIGYTAAQSINLAIGYEPDQRIIRQSDDSLKENSKELYDFCPDEDKKRVDYWCRKFLQISRDISEINTIIQEWSLNGDKRETVDQLLRKVPQYLAISLEHYCEIATKQVFRSLLVFQYTRELMENHQLDQVNAAKRARSRANNQLENQIIRASVGLFKQVLTITNQPYQEPSEQQFLFKEIESIHQCPTFVRFDLNRNNSFVSWAIYRLYKRTADKIIRSYAQTEIRDNHWRELYHFCREFSDISPEKRQSILKKLESELKKLEIPEHSVNYFTGLILVFAQMYVPEQETVNGRPQPRYREPNNELLQRMANEFNRRLSLRKDAKEMKDELLNFYLIFSNTTPPDWKITSLDNAQENDDGSESTTDVHDPNIPPSPEATELKELLPNFINQLDNTPKGPYQVLLLLEYGFEDKLFMAEDGEGNVKLDQTEIGVILGGNPQHWVKRKKRDALTRLINLIRELSSERELNSDAIAEIKKLLEKQLLPDYYFELIRSWIVDDLAKIPLKQRQPPQIRELESKIKQKITIEIEKAGFKLSPEGLALLEPPINRLVEVYAIVTPEQP